MPNPRRLSSDAATSEVPTTAARIKDNVARKTTTVNKIFKRVKWVLGGMDTCSSRYASVVEYIDWRRVKPSLTFGCIEYKLRCYPGTLSTPQALVLRLSDFIHIRGRRNTVQPIFEAVHFEPGKEVYVAEDEDIRRVAFVMRKPSIRMVWTTLRSVFGVIFVVVVNDRAGAKASSRSHQCHKVDRRG